jgi:Ca2+-binding RTX toxin-like protein
MRGTRTAIGLAAGLLALLALAAPALATFVPLVRYDPPLIKVADQPGHLSTETIEVRKDGDEYSITNGGVGVAEHPDSRNGCTGASSADYRCPVQGIRRIVVSMGGLGDTLVIDLGSRADTVKQLAFGESGGDVMEGHEGAQDMYGEGGEDVLDTGGGPDILRGGRNDDTLVGGSGPDHLKGGPGNDDVCDGGPGQDTAKGCETFAQ